MDSVERAPRRYWVEVAVTAILYFAALWCREWLLPLAIDPVEKIGVALLPVPPVCLGLWVVYRFYRRIDEYHRIRFLKAVTVSGGATALIAITWGFLVDAGAPEISAVAILLIAVFVYSYVVFLFQISEAADAGRIGKGLAILARLCVIAGGAGLLALFLSLKMGWPLWPSVMVAVPCLTVTGITSMSIGVPRFFP